jgi:hypothetical protein
MRKTILVCVMAVLMALIIGGCVQTDIVLKIKPDGSGTIEETVLMNQMIMTQMGAMFGQMGDGELEINGEAAALPDMFDEEKLKARALKMGKGVRYVSGSPIQNGDFSGYKAIYAFSDINTLQIDENPGSRMPMDVPGEEAGMDMNTGEEWVRFQFERGNPARLVIRRPESEREAEPDEEEAESETDDSMEAGDMAGMGDMMGMFFKDMKMRFVIDVQGHIVKTNATHREGSEITLLEMDFGKIMENPEKFQQLSRSKPKSMAETAEMVRDIPGIKVDLNDQMEIVFQ